MAGKDLISESSDTDKTSGSLFKAVGSGSRRKRREELSIDLKRYTSFDEFCSSVASESTNSEFTNLRLHKRLRHHAEYERKSKCKNNSMPEEAHEIAVNREMQALDKEAIAELDREYDHNTCLDRFINEQNQQATKQFDEVGSISKSNSADKSTCSYCCDGSCGCRTSGSSSVAPQSNDGTDSVSRKSDSIKSISPEIGKSDQTTDSIDIVTTPQPERLLEVLYPVENARQGEELYVAKMFSSGTESGIDMNLSTSKASSSGTVKNYKGGKPGRKRKRGYIYDPKPVKIKPPKQVISDSCKNTSYWEKRKRNNEAAKKSRQMRRSKEQEVSGKLIDLKRENDALKVTIALLIERNETLEHILNDYAIAELEKEMIEVPVTL